MNQQSKDILSKLPSFLGPILRIAAQNKISRSFNVYDIFWSAKNCFLFNLQIVTSAWGAQAGGDEHQ